MYWKDTNKQIYCWQLPWVLLHCLFVCLFLKNAIAHENEHSLIRWESVIETKICHIPSNIKTWDQLLSKGLLLYIQMISFIPLLLNEGCCNPYKLFNFKTYFYEVNFWKWFHVIVITMLLPFSYKRIGSLGHCKGRSSSRRFRWIR